MVKIKTLEKNNLLKDLKVATKRNLTCEKKISRKNSQIIFLI